MLFMLSKQTYLPFIPPPSRILKIFFNYKYCGSGKKSEDFKNNSQDSVKCNIDNDLILKGNKKLTVFNNNLHKIPFCLCKYCMPQHLSVYVLKHVWSKLKI